MKLMIGAAAILAAGMSAPAFAQDNSGGTVHVGVSAGSLGIGPEIGWRGDNVGVRGSATFFGYSRDVDSDGVEYDGDLKLRSFGGTVDFYPGGGGFRLSAGARISNNRVELKATPTTNVEVGDNVYTPAQIGTLSGDIKANKLAPTLTIGYGSGRGQGFSFGIDGGIMLQGSPEVKNLRTSGSLSSAALAADIAREEEELEDDIDNFKIYPILQISLGYRF